MVNLFLSMTDFAPLVDKSPKSVEKILLFDAWLRWLLRYGEICAQVLKQALFDGCVEL